MEQLTKRLCNLLTIKSLVTVALTAVFCFITVKGVITGEEFLTVFTMIVSFYFGTQVEKNRG